MKLQEMKNRKSNHIDFHRLSEEFKDIILNGEALKNEAIVDTLEDPAENDREAQRIVQIIERRMQNSSLFVCRISKILARHLDFENLGGTERRLSTIFEEAIQDVLIPEIATSEYVNQKLIYGVPVHFVPLKESRVTLVLGGETFKNVNMNMPDFETVLHTIHKRLENERESNERLNELECKYLTHIVRF